MNDSAQFASAARTWKVTLAYDGTDFAGWQIQPGQLTIQGTLQSALSRTTGESPLPQGSGRTDAGVHALAQVASFALNAPIPPASLLHALNRILPCSIRVLDAQIVDNGFHARHSAVAKTYEYRVYLEKSAAGSFACPPFLARYVYAYPWPLDLDALRESAAHLVGEHDFVSFAATDPDLAARAFSTSHDTARLANTPAPTAVRTIYSSGWEREPIAAGELLVYRVRGDGFLHHMVRNLVGTMLDVGRGYRPASDIPAILAAHRRSAAGPTAPARGLFLHSVEY